MTQTGRGDAERERIDETRLAELRYLGRMAASISHELRNSLATITEKNGLIADFAALAASGRPLNEARIGSLAGDVARRIKEATEVCDRLSRLAHSPDLATKVVELGSQVELVSGLMRRQARLAGVTIAVTHQGPVNVHAEPVLLQLALFECLGWAIAHPIGAEVQAAVGRRASDAAYVSIRGARWAGLLPDPPHPLRQALTMLGAELVAGETEDEAIILQPTSREAKETRAKGGTI
jgi:hypothetical protein